MAFTPLAPLRHKSFALALSSSFVSSVGTWMQSVALGVYLTQKTHNAEWLGLITVAAWTPALIGSPLGGVFADRFNRQRWIQANNLVMAITASLLATAELTHHLSPQLACYLAVVEGFCSAASWAAWQSLLPDLVGGDEVLAAVSLSSAQFNLGRIIGPAAAGIALAAGSTGICFALNAVSFVAALVGLVVGCAGPSCCRGWPGAARAAHGGRWRGAPAAVRADDFHGEPGLAGGYVRHWRRRGDFREPGIVLV